MRDSLGRMLNTLRQQWLLWTCALAIAFGCSHRRSLDVRPLPGPEPPRWGTPAWRQYLTHVTDSLRTVDPYDAADSAAARGDFHLLAVLGYSLYVPALAGYPQSFDHPVFYFPAGSDAIEGKEHSLYMRVTSAYAEDYNSTILESLHRHPSRFALVKHVAGCFSLTWQPPNGAAHANPLPTVLVLDSTPHKVSGQHLNTWQFGDASLSYFFDSVAASGEWGGANDSVTTSLWSRSGNNFFLFVGFTNDSLSGRATVLAWGLSKGNVMRTGRVFGSKIDCSHSAPR